MSRHDEPWMTKREIAARLRVSTRTIERLRLPMMRVGGQNRYLMSQVTRALAEGIDAAGATAGELPPNVIPLRRSRKDVVA